MKILVSSRPAVFTRSMLAFGAGCVLASLPLSVANAQDSSSTVPRTTGPVDATKPASERPKINGDEQTFIKMAAAGNETEIMASKLALKKSETPAVKSFAEKMITDHGKANRDLEALAKRSQVTDFKPMVTADQKATYEKLSALKGQEFDEAYIKAMVVDHSKDLDDYKQAHNMVTSKDLLNYVNTTEPIIGMHYKMAKELDKGETKS